MNSVIRLMFCLVLFINLCSCGSEEELIEANIGNHEIQQEVISHLREKNIYFESVGDASIKVRASDMPFVVSLVNETAKTVLPKGKNLSVRADLHDRIVEELISRNINFTVTNLDENKFIVFEKTADANLANQLLDEIVDSELRKKFGRKN